MKRFIFALLSALAASASAATPDTAAQAVNELGLEECSIPLELFAGEEMFESA